MASIVSSKMLRAILKGRGEFVETLTGFKWMGCYFTKFCKELAEQLRVGGWVKNSKKGTIVGKMQGTKAQLDHMINWLSTTGSPGCKIEKCDLTNWEYVTKIAYTDFSIRF